MHDLNNQSNPDAKAETPAHPPFAMVFVESNQVKAVGYDAATETLAMQFKHGAGAIYHYPNVPKEVHEAMMASESIGKFFGQHIKPLPFVKYTPELGVNADKTAEEAA